MDKIDVSLVANKHPQLDLFNYINRKVGENLQYLEITGLYRQTKLGKLRQFFQRSYLGKFYPSVGVTTVVVAYFNQDDIN